MIYKFTQVNGLNQYLRRKLLRAAMVLRVPMMIFVAHLLVSCSTKTNWDRAYRSHAAKSATGRVGEQSNNTLVPTAERNGGASQRTSLETPDPSPRRPTIAWLRGIWLQTASPDDLSRVACNSGTTMTYEADGTTSSFEGRGRWQLVGDWLTETLIEVDEAGSPEMLQDVGRPSTNRIRRIGPDEGAVQVGGLWEPMLRCRPGDVTVGSAPSP
jgi:hypothetical protein